MAEVRYLCLRRAHFYATILLTTFPMIALTLLMPDIATHFFGGSPDVCAQRSSTACADAQSKASLALGISNGMKSLIGVLLAPAIGALSDVYGRRFFWIGSIIALIIYQLAVLLCIMGVASLWPSLALNIFTGLSFGIYASIVADDSAPAGRTRAFGWLVAMFDIGILIVPALTSALTLQNAMSLMLAGSIIGLMLVVLYGETLPASQRLSPSIGMCRWRPDFALRILASSPLFRRLSLTILASTVPMAGVGQVFILFLEASYGLSRTDATGFLVILAASGLLVVSFVLPILVHRLGTTWSLLVGLGFQFLQAICFTFLHSQFALVLGCIFGGFGVMVFPCVAALKANAAPEFEQGRVQGAITSIQSLGQALGPLIYGPLFAFLVRSDSPAGHPLPQAVFGVSIVSLLIAGASAVALLNVVPNEVPPIPCCIVSAPLARETSEVLHGTSLILAHGDKDPKADGV